MTNTQNIYIWRAQEPHFIKYLLQSGEDETEIGYQIAELSAYKQDS